MQNVAFLLQWVVVLAVRSSTGIDGRVIETSSLQLYVCGSPWHTFIMVERLNFSLSTVWIFLCQKKRIKDDGYHLFLLLLCLFLPACSRNRLCLFRDVNGHAV